ncbi:tripartite tricarboxylate transporter family receptor domain protein [Bordetella bronchiseptica D989]|nr:tripartite tricarboxylate transporter family receptor domain protein [Bordetella bronchiseptica D989]
MGAIAIITTAFALAGVPAQAGATPSDQPLRIVVPYAPGGTGDVIARLVAKKLGEQSGQSVVVENKPGAAGSIGASTVARAAADGNTLLLGYTSEMVINPIVQKGVSYDVARDFAPVAMAGSTPLLLVANPTVGANSIAELVALATSRTRPPPTCFMACTKRWRCCARKACRRSMRAIAATRTPRGWRWPPGSWSCCAWIRRNAARRSRRY